MNVTDLGKKEPQVREFKLLVTEDVVHDLYEALNNMIRMYEEPNIWKYNNGSYYEQSKQALFKARCEK